MNKRIITGEAYQALVRKGAEAKLHELQAEIATLEQFLNGHASKLAEPVVDEPKPARRSSWSPEARAAAARRMRLRHRSAKIEARREANRERAETLGERLGAMGIGTGVRRGTR